MKKRILPFIVAMSVALPIQSFAAESVKSTQESNQSDWKVAWQSGNSIVKYKIVKWTPTKSTNAPVVKKEQAQAPVKQEAKPVAQAETKQEAAPAAQLEKQVEQAPVVATQKEADSAILSVEQEVVRLVNVERAKEGLQPLTMDVELQKVAKKKSEDMKAKNYFSHTSPTYGSPFDMMKQFGITYTAAGENIAKGQTSAKQVVDAWMNSAGHRANIMSTSFTHIGVGYVESGHYWTQMFIKK